MALSEEITKYTFKEKAHRFYRGTLFQAILLGLISFTQPGIWSAVNGLGGGGQATPYTANAANVVTFALMIVFSPLMGIIGNIYGMRWVLAFGTLGYAPYSAALYCNTVYGTQWFMVFGAATCGLSASALWTAEGAIAVSYPEPARRGLYIGIWIAINKLGGIIANAIQLALNAKTSTQGSISSKTYLVLTILQCLGLPLALMVSPPEKLIRSDGKKPVFGNKERTWKTETKALFQIIQRKEIFLMIPIYISCQWGGTYNGNFTAAYFSVRARALLSFVMAIVGAILNVGTGLVLDSKTSRPLRARAMWIFLTAGFTAVFIWDILLQKEYNVSKPVFDWSTSGFSRGAGNVVFYRILGEIIFCYLYWVLGTYDSHADTLGITMGILRSGESLGQCLSYKVGSLSHISLMTNLVVSAVVFWASVPTTFWAAWLVPSVPTGELKDESDEESGVQRLDVSLDHKTVL